MNYYVIGCVPLLLVLAALVLAGTVSREAAYHRPDPSPPWRQVGSAFIFILATFAYLVASRWNSINFPAVLGTDEVQFAANALIGSHQLLNWHNSDCGSSGPLTCQLLALPTLFGVDITIASTRTIACLLIAITAFYLYNIIFLICRHEWAALSLTLPFIYLYGRTHHTDFLHYSSELAPNTLIYAALYHQLKQHKTNKRIDLLLCGLFLGFVPYTKLQAVPMAFLIGITTLVSLLALSHHKKTGIRKCLTVVIAASVPTTLYLMPLLLTGNFHHFLNSYLVMAADYVASPLSLTQIVTMIHADENLLRYTITLFITSVIVLMAFLFGRKNPTNTDTTDIPTIKHSAYILLFTLLLLCTAVYSISKPGMLFPHYLNFLPPTLAIFCAGLFRFMASFCRVKKRTPKWMNMAMLLPAILMATYASSVTYFISSVENRAAKKLSPLHAFQAPGIFDPLLGEHPDYMLSWGWNPEWYLAAAITPATRYTTASIHIVDYPLKPYFNQRLLEDLSRHKPGIILDTLPLSAYTSRDSHQYFASEITSPINSLIRAEYTAITRHHASGEVPLLYVHHDILYKLQHRVVSFAGIKASATRDALVDVRQFSPENTDDNSFGSVDDRWYWALPDNTLGYIEYTFAAPETIERIHLLNTGAEFRSTDKIQITLFNADHHIVAEIQTRMKAYPFWTDIRAANLDNPQAVKSMRITILSHLGNGAGLDEVKVLRQHP